MQTISFHSWEPQFNEMIECLCQTKLIHWNSGPLIANVAPEYSEQIKNIVASKGVTIQRARKCQGFILPHADAININEVK